MPQPASPEHTRPVLRQSEVSSERLGWDQVAVKAYKPTGTHFHQITRQVLFGEADGLPAALRYFELQPGGYSTLEKHAHVHAVMVLRGQGRVLVGETIHTLEALDLVYVPPHTWHQFRADTDQSLGFLCLVDCQRDKPVRPDATVQEQLLADPVLGAFIRL